MSDQDIGRSQFPKQHSQLQKRRQEALSRPLTQQEIATLLAMHYHGEPVYESAEQFYSEEFKNASASGLSPAELSKIQRYRPPTSEEANQLYCDVHARDEKTQYTAFHTEGE